MIKETALDPELAERLKALLALATPTAKWPSPTASRRRSAASTRPRTPHKPRTSCATSSTSARRRSAPLEVRRLAKTLRNWFDQILAWHEAKVSNGPTEGMNNLMKRVKSVAFGFTNFRELQDQGPALRRQAQLQSPRLDGGQMTSGMAHPAKYRKSQKYPLTWTFLERTTGFEPATLTLAI